MSDFCLIEAVEAEGFGGGGVVAAAFGDVQLAGVLDGRDDGGADGCQVGGPAAGPAGGGVFAERGVPYGSRSRRFASSLITVMIRKEGTYVRAMRPRLSRSGRCLGPGQADGVDFF